MNDLESTIFELIVHSGNARALLYEALDFSQTNSKNEVHEKLNNVKKEMVLAHNLQTKLIQDNLKGEGEISLLLIHAQDQFMTAMTEQVLIEKMINMQYQINSISAE